MKKKAFTLVELAIALTIIGLLIGGSFKVMKMMREKAKTQEAKEQVLAAKNAVIGDTLKNYDIGLPDVTYFNQNLSPSKDLNHPFLYIAASNLQGNDICAFTSTDLNVTILNDDNSVHKIENNVAFVVAHEGANYNMQTAASSPLNTYFPSRSIDANATPMNKVESYDDVVEWVSLEQLKNEIGCANRPFRFITDKLPNAKVAVSYNAKLMVENNISEAIITCNPSSLSGISFNGGIGGSNTFSGEANASGTASFNCSANEAAPSSRTITKDFVITIDPYLNKAQGLTCTQDSECASGICYGGVCRGGTSGEACGDDGDCQSGICVSNVCRSGIALDPCVNSGDCQSGICIGGVCQAGTVTNSCNSGNDCISGFCAAGACTTGAFDAPCDDGGDCKSGICLGGLCSGYLGDGCGANTNCLSGYCDSNTSLCAIMPSGGGSGGSSGGGGGGGSGVAPSCSVASSAPVINSGSSATLSYTITNGPASGIFTPSGGSCTNFSNSTGGSCTTANLTRNTSFALSVSNTYGNGSCNTEVCVARAEYRVWNNTGSRRDFRIDGTCRRVNNNSEITTATYRLNAGESIIQYSSSNTTCSTEVASITFNQAACADDDADSQVYFSGADR